MGTARVVRTSSMAGANGKQPGPPANVTDHTKPAQEPEPAPAPESATVAGSTPEPEDAPKPVTRRSRRSAASKDSAAGKARAKKVKPPSPEDFTLVGEVMHIAFNGGKDAVDPGDLLDAWRARIDAWDRVHTKAGK